MRGAMKVGATSPNYLPFLISAGDHSKAKGTFRQEAETKVRKSRGLRQTGGMAAPLVACFL